MVTKQGEVLYKEPEGILFQGYLQKQGAINKAFKTRYFRLVERPCQVWYYKNESSRTPRGGIKLCNSGVEITTSIPCMVCTCYQNLKLVFVLDARASEQHSVLLFLRFM